MKNNTNLDEKLRKEYNLFIFLQDYYVLSSVFKLGLVFFCHYYQNKILSFLENAEENEETKIYFCLKLEGYVYIFFPRVSGIGIDFFIPIPVIL